MSVLRDCSPSWSKRNGMVCTFYRYGYTEEEVFEFIQLYNRWDDFDEDKTRIGIHKAYIYKHHLEKQAAGSSIQKHSSLHLPFFSKKKPILAMDIIHKFLLQCKPWKVSPPCQIREAAMYYHSMGGHVIPLRKPWYDKKKDRWETKTPGARWKVYQVIQPSLMAIAGWKWNYGIILLGTEKHCFLDIDMKSLNHLNGLENFDETLLKGWWYERTKNGGFHVFGQGNMKSEQAGGAEIKGKGKYIVTYPTPGYVLGQEARK